LAVRAGSLPERTVRAGDLTKERSMMHVETYEAVETGFDGAVECDAEALALIEQLGLEGQQKLVAKNDAGDDVRNPYRKMTADENYVYSLLLSRKVKLDQYDDGPIPLRVLQVAAHAKDHFSTLMVWCPENADVKDPILLGYTGNEYSRERFMLARWGEVLEPLDKLRPLAAAKHRAKLQADCAKAQAKVAADAAAIESMSLDAIASLGADKGISYYGLS
jgi:hypothetical protein